MNDRSRDVFSRALTALNSRDINGAKALLEETVRLDRGHVPAHNLLAVILMSLGRFAEAEPYIAMAVKLDANSDVSFYNYGLISKHLSKPQQALDNFNKSIALNKNVADTWNNRGTIHNELDRHDEAVADFDRAIALKPDYAAAYVNKGNSLIKLKRDEEALSAYNEALRLNPSLVEALLGGANALAALRRFDEALVALDKALVASPALNVALIGRGNALTGMKRYDEALAAYDKAIATVPQTEVDAWIGRGNVLSKLKRYDEALAALDQALAIDTEFADGYLRKALIHLGFRRFAPGWDLYEWRFQALMLGAGWPRLDAMNVKLRVPAQDLVGRDVIVLAEQGVGDEVMFASVLPDLMRDARSVIYEADKRLHPLFERSFAGVKFIDLQRERQELEHSADIVVKAGTLSYAYRQSSELFPGSPYLILDRSRVSYWRGELESRAPSSVKIGVSWRGGTVESRTEERSFDIRRLRFMTEIKSVQLVSLQYGDVQDEIEEFNRSGNGATIEKPLDHMNDFDEMAALVGALDLVISVQNTTVHVSGAVGRPCWGLIPWSPEWRYGEIGRDMLWYSSVTLYRQEKPDDWDGVLERVKVDAIRFVEGLGRV